jgi:hypothetical protein
MTTTTSATRKSWAGSSEEWAGRAGPHNVTLRSGQKVTFRLMGLGELMLRGYVPSELRELVGLHFLNQSQGGLDAVLAAGIVNTIDDPATEDRLQQQLQQNFELTKALVQAALVDPKPSLEELDSYPFEDLEQLARLVKGLEPFDSVGVRIGVEEIDVLARFRALHGCDRRKTDCKPCRELLDELSSLHVGGV